MTCWNRFISLRFIVTVEPILFVYVLALALKAPLLQQYIYGEISKEYNFTSSSNKSVCRTNGSWSHAEDNDLQSLENKVQTFTSHWLIYLNLASTVPAIVTSSMYGPWSDKVGRKPILIIALTGEMIDALTNISIIAFGLPYYLLLVGAFFSGLGGSFMTVLAAVFSYVSDNTDEAQRAFRIGVLDSMAYFGAMAGFFVGGVWTQSSGGYAQPFWGALGLMGVNLLYAVLILPPSKQEAIVEIKKSKPITCDNLKNVLLLFKEYKLLGLALLAFFFVCFSLFNDLTVLYTKASPLCWNSKTIGYYYTLMTAVAALGTIIILKVASNRVSDTSLAMFGMIGTAAYNVVKAFATTTAVMFWSAAPLFFGGLVNPCLRTVMSKLVPSTKQGTVFTAIAITEVSSKLVVPSIYNIIYPISRTSLHFPGFCFLMTAGISLFSVFLVIPIFCVRKRSEYEPMPSTEGGAGHDPLSTLTESYEEKNASSILAVNS